MTLAWNAILHVLSKKSKVSRYFINYADIVEYSEICNTKILSKWLYLWEKSCKQDRDLREYLQGNVKNLIAMCYFRDNHATINLQEKHCTVWHDQNNMGQFQVLADVVIWMLNNVGLSSQINARTDINLERRVLRVLFDCPTDCHNIA